MPQITPVSVTKFSVCAIRYFGLIATVFLSHTDFNFLFLLLHISYIGRVFIWGSRSHSQLFRCHFRSSCAHVSRILHPQPHPLSHFNSFHIKCKDCSCHFQSSSLHIPPESFVAVLSAPLRTGPSTWSFLANQVRSCV